MSKTMSKTYAPEFADDDRPGPPLSRWDAETNRWDELENASVAHHNHRPRWVVRAAILVALAVALLGGAAYGAVKVMDGGTEQASNTGLAATPAPDAVTGDASSPTDGAAAPVGDPAATPTEAATPAVAATPTGAQPPATKPAPPKPRPVAPTALAPGDEATQVLALTNAARARKGCAPLTAEPRLAAAAQGHAADMAAQNYFDHTSKDGSSMADRVDRQGYRWGGLAENIAKGQPTPQAVVDGWMNSAGHRRNIETCGYTHLGVGIARQGRSLIWVQNFGSPR